MSNVEDRTDLPWLFLCHGAANVGQMSNDAARELVKEGRVKVACIAAAGAHAESFLKPFRSGRDIVCIDGCPMKCASKTLEHADVPVARTIMVTELGIKKSGDLSYTQQDVNVLKKKLEEGIFPTSRPHVALSSPLIAFDP